MNYPIPSWLRAAEPAKYWLQGVSTGASIAAENNRVRAQQAQLDMAQRQAETENLRQQEQLAFQKASHDATLNLKRQELEQDQARVNLATEQAARRFAANQQYAQMVAGGMDPAQAMLKLAPALGLSAGDIGAVMRNSRPVPTPTLGKTESGQEYAIFGDQFKWGPRPATKPENLGEPPGQVRPVTGPDGQTLPGMVWVPNTKGGWTVRNTNDSGARQAAARLKQLDEGPLGVFLSQGIAELPEELAKADPARATAYKRIKAQYDQLQKIVNGDQAIDVDTKVEPQAGAAAPAGITFTRIRKKGDSTWTDLGTPAPTADATPEQRASAPSHDEDDQTPSRTSTLDRIRSGASSLVRSLSVNQEEPARYSPTEAPADPKKRRLNQAYYVDGELMIWTKDGWQTYE